MGIPSETISSYNSTILLPLHGTAKRNKSGETQTYNPMNTVTARRIIENQFGVDYKLHHDKNTMDAALIERLFAMLDQDYTSKL